MHPPEPIYPCYLPVLGEFNRMTPHEGPSTSLPEVIEPSEFADMCLVRAKKWTHWDYVQCSRVGVGMSIVWASANRSLATS